MDTPNTINFMVLGYTVFSVVMALYIASLYLRRRNLDQDLKLMEELQRKEEKK